MSIEPATAVRVWSPPVERQIDEVVANAIINFPSYKDQAYQWCMPLPGQFDKPVFPVYVILLHLQGSARVFGKILFRG